MFFHLPLVATSHADIYDFIYPGVDIYQSDFFFRFVCGDLSFEDLKNSTFVCVLKHDVIMTCPSPLWASWVYTGNNDRDQLKLLRSVVFTVGQCHTHCPVCQKFQF